jgi:hypothetical protein
MRKRKTMRIAPVGLAIILTFGSFPKIAATQDESIDSDIRILRADLRADKLKVVTEEMQLSDNEAKSFWPIYRAYDADLTKLNDQKVDLLKEYADIYGSMTNDQVESFAKRSFALQKQRVDLRADYFARISRAVSPRTAARFVQVEDRIDLLLNLQLAASIPMVQK